MKRYPHFVENVEEGHKICFSRINTYVVRLPIYLCCEMLYYIDASHLDHANLYRVAERSLLTQAWVSFAVYVVSQHRSSRGRMYVVGV
jgi:hypothetical protein